MTKPPQARNAIKRALAHVVGLRFSKSYKASCREHFAHFCAYCGEKIPIGSRKGHLDHAVALAARVNQYHLVYACAGCNGDEKRDESWELFLTRKCDGDAETIHLRKQKILDWFQQVPPAAITKELTNALRQAEKQAIDSFDKAAEQLRELARNNSPCTALL